MNQTSTRPDIHTSTQTCMHFANSLHHCKAIPISREDVADQNVALEEEQKAVQLHSPATALEILPARIKNDLDCSFATSP